MFIIMQEPTYILIVPISQLKVSTDLHRIENNVRTRYVGQCRGTAMAQDVSRLNAMNPTVSLCNCSSFDSKRRKIKGYLFFIPRPQMQSA